MAVPDKSPAQGDPPGGRGLRDRFLARAVEAEYATGRREETEDEAKAHLLVRVGRIAGGTALCLIGVAGLLLPVLPGWIFLIPGLALLSFDVPFAARLLEKVRHRLPQDRDGKLPRSTIVLSVVGVAAVAGVSLWWTFLAR